MDILHVQRARLLLTFYSTDVKTEVKLHFFPEGVRFALQFLPSRHFRITKMASKEKTKLLFRWENQIFFFQKKWPKLKQIKSSVECFFLSLQSLSLCRGPHVTSHWGPSCWSPWPTPATPPWAGCTVTTHSNRSDQVARGAQVHQVYQRFHEVPSLRHDRLFRRPAGLVYLEYKHDVKNILKTTVTKWGHAF